jgi:hypothetical protein
MNTSQGVSVMARSLRGRRGSPPPSPPSSRDLYQPPGSPDKANSKTLTGRRRRSASRTQSRVPGLFPIGKGEYELRLEVEHLPVADWARRFPVRLAVGEDGDDVVPKARRDGASDLVHPARLSRTG